MLSTLMTLSGLIILSFMNFGWLIFIMGSFFLLLMILMKNCSWMMMNNVGFLFGDDTLSYSLVLLSVWIMLLMIVSSNSINFLDTFKHEFMILLMFLLFFLVTSFLMTSMMWFYLMFEASLIPTLMMILGWGYQPERLQAGIYLFLYTLFMSMPFLLMILKIFLLNGSDLFVFEFFINSKMLYWCFIMAFLVKMPMFFFHLWLPKAHVEAPVAGSMILAGILLKLGGYGILRILSMLKSYNNLSSIWFSVALLGGVITSFVCLGQMDMKSLVAYSSIGHMSLVIAGIFSFNWMGVAGSFMMLISHGLCSSGLFCGVNMIYEKMTSRSILVSKGLMNIFPSFTLWWFLLCSCNMSAPPCLGFGSEVLLYCSIMKWSLWIVMILILLSFLAGAYSLFLFSFSQHGMFLKKFSVTNFSAREYTLLLSHWVPLNLLIVWVELFF